MTGRVYNGQNRPPGPATGAATVSLFKSFASPGGAVNNSFGFDDTAGSEQVAMNAGKDWNSTVGHDRNETDRQRQHVQRRRGPDRVDGIGPLDVGGQQQHRDGGRGRVGVAWREPDGLGREQPATAASAPTRASRGRGSYLCGRCEPDHDGGADDKLTVGANQTTAVGASRVGGREPEQSVGGTRTVS